MVVWNRQLHPADVSCLLAEMSQFVAVCQAPSEMWGTVWQDDLTSLPTGVFMGNDAYVDPNVGFTFDGQGDYAVITGIDGFMQRGYGRVAGSWQRTGPSFTISFWFTKTECTVPGYFEYLYQHKPPTDTSWRSGPRVEMMIGCPNFYTTQSLSGVNIPGAAVRVAMRDDDGAEANFAIPLTAEARGGYVSDM